MIIPSDYYILDKETNIYSIPYDDSGKILHIHVLPEKYNLLEIPILPEGYPTVMGGKNFVNEDGIYHDHRVVIYQYKVDVETKTLVKEDSLEANLLLDLDSMVVGAMRRISELLTIRASLSDKIILDWQKAKEIGNPYDLSAEEISDLKSYLEYKANLSTLRVNIMDAGNDIPTLLSLLTTLYTMDV